MKLFSTLNAVCHSTLKILPKMYKPINIDLNMKRK